MKRIGFIILSILLLAAMMAFPVCAAEDPSVSINSVSGVPGDTVTLTVSLSGLEKATHIGVGIEASEGLELMADESLWLIPSVVDQVDGVRSAWAVNTAVNVNDDVLQLAYRLTEDFKASEAFVKVTVDVSNSTTVLAQAMKATASFTCSHEEVETVVPPTCTEVGYTEHSCKYCDLEVWYDNYVNAGHAWKEATCETPMTCEICHVTEGEALGHEMGEWTVVKEATTTEEGEKKSVCLREGCDHTEKDSIPKVKLPVPSVSISNDAATGKIKLSWKKISDASKYEIYYATSKTGTYSKLTTATGTSLTHSKAEAGKTYYYKVRCVDAAGAKSDFSTPVNRTCDLARPEVSISNDAATGKNKLSWTKITGASKYEIYYATSKTGTYSKLTTATGTSLTHSKAEAGKTYYYKVKAIHKTTAANSAESAVVNITCDLARPEITASNVESSGKIKLTWKKITGASKYEIYRATSKTGTYSKLTTVTGTSYTDTGAAAGKTYYYKVKAIHKTSAANSADAAVVSIVCDLARPDVTASNVESSGKIKLTWKKISGATKYEIYRATSKTGTYKKVTTVTGTSYTDSSAVAGKTYYYKVKALHKTSAANSAYSSVDSLTCDLARPDVTAKLSSKKVNLTWKKVEGAKKYEVYRATSKTGTYKLIKTTTSLKYTDKDVKTGKTYYYKVVAVHSTSAANSAFSSIDSVKVK